MKDCFKVHAEGRITPGLDSHASQLTNVTIMAVMGAGA
jgi:hypothetical protein